MRDFSEGFTAPGVAQLAKAVVKDDARKVNLLLAKGATLDGVGIEGLNVSVLMLALIARRRKAFRALLEAGADTRHHDDDGATVLHYAARIEDPWYLRTLLEYPVDVNIADSKAGTSPLIDAESDEQFRMLIAAGADPNTRGRWGGAALHDAAQRLCYEQVLDLLEAGADPLCLDESGRSFQYYLEQVDPLDQGIAYREIRARITAWLREHGFDIEPLPEVFAILRARANRYRAVGYIGDGAGGWVSAFTIDPAEFADVLTFGSMVESALEELQRHGVPAKVVQMRYGTGDPVFELPSWAEFRTS
ncbi:ankyrin repeat domain-containing protein [Nocardia sp. NPDC057668]|uniref:ankyrin repeat domain-containing protein n=1 Tax=Nocardia sp. NPDC057668 TaxID=3346202 RepID=UPI00366BB5FB